LEFQIAYKHQIKLMMIVKNLVRHLKNK